MNLDTQDNLNKTADTPETPLDSDPIYKNEDRLLAGQVKDGLSQYFPIISDDGSTALELEDVEVDRRRDMAEDPGQIAEARYEGRSYELPVRGQFVLKKDGKEVDRTKLKLGPYYPVAPGLNTRLINGRLYQNKFQVRRMPGVYPFKNDSGKALVEFNTSKGRSFNMGVDSEGDGLQTMDLIFTGANRKTVDKGAYALLRAMGHSDDTIKDTWGEDLWRQNATTVGESGERPMTDEELKKLIDKTYFAFKE